MGLPSIEPAKRAKNVRTQPRGRAALQAVGIIKRTGNPWPPDYLNLTRAMNFFDSSDPDRQANIAFALIFLGIIAVGGLTIWIFYGGAIQ